MVSKPVIGQRRERMVKKRPQDIVGPLGSPPVSRRACPTQSHGLLTAVCTVAIEVLEGLRGIHLWEEDVRVKAEEVSRSGL